ncbi:peptidase [Duganella sp. FT3S]|uniref:Peptidase n=1 Tax=Rugamonas fusca TaxID=2758568 RepID=A0A7W2EFS9_9BURK|nr:M56 family metallopeptidase [Rugamonas fusca]MBA5605138.1 peptidase [Rugamonas fusca]
MAWHLWTDKLLLASAACVLASALLRGALALLARRLPAIAARRAIWLVAHGIVAATFMLTLAPRPARLSLLPALTPPSGTAQQAHPPSLTVTTTSANTTHDMQAARAPAMAPARAADLDPAGASAPAYLRTSVWQAFDLLACAWSAIYLAGLARAIWRLSRARRLWRALLVGARRLDHAALQAHGAFDAAQLAAMGRGGLAVLETEAPVSPMLLGARRPMLLLPRQLRTFEPAQQHLIIEHEFTHWRRHDPAWLAVAPLLRTLCWFAPGLRWLSARLAMAQELACDQRVLAGRPSFQRQQYALALMRQLRAQNLPTAALAFGGEDGHSVAARIRLIRQPIPAALGTQGACLLAVLFGAVLAVPVLLQPVLAMPAATGARPLAPIAWRPAPAQAAAPWRYPLEHMRVTGFYGVRRGTLPIHHGIDLVAAPGTPVHAVAAGTVLAAGP